MATEEPLTCQIGTIVLVWMKKSTHLAKGTLSSHMRRAVASSSDDLQCGDNGTRLRITPEARQPKRTLEAHPIWKGKVAYEDEVIWESEW